MNENLEHPKDKAERLSFEHSALLTKFLELFSHGFACIEKGDYDRAIAIFDEFLRLAPKLADLIERAKELGTDDKKVKNYDQLMTLAGLVFRGIACHKKGHHEQAIANFSEALRLELPHNVIKTKGFFYFGYVYSCRGFVYIDQENFLTAFKDFVKANECDPVLKTQMPAIYIAVQIAAIYKDKGEDDRGKAFELYLSLLDAIIDIQKKQFYWPGKSKEVAHYTSLHTLKGLADKGHFRLYNAAYMNDPEEGRVFFDIMKKSGMDVKKVFYGDASQPYPSPAYIGSFIKVDVKETKQKDELFLWRTYGKHDGQEAAGACLIFKHEGTVFAENCGSQIGAMQQLQARLFMAEGNRQIPEKKQPRKPDLYEIVYSDENLSPRSPVEELRLSLRGYSDGEINRGLSEELNKLAESLKQIKKHFEEEKDNDNKKKLRKLACDLLDTIRFLFKARHYKEEKEVRVVQVRYYDETKTAQEPDDIQVDMEQIPPRFYLETDENFRFSEVILGPQTRGVPEWKRWLKERDIKVDQSEIQYGKPYP